jgi:hypothetical protein
MSNNDIIEPIYNDPAGHGSIKTTYEDAKAKDSSITYGDVQAWFHKNIDRKRQLKGYNSFIASEPFEEFQVDLAFWYDLKDPEFPASMFIIDIFTKYLTIIPMKTNNAPTFLETLKTGIYKMGGVPKTIYADAEGSWHNKAVKQYLQDNSIRLIETLAHAAVVERAIRTIKHMVYTRIETAKKKNNEDKRWVDVLYPVLLTYNVKLKHSATNMTPSEARKPINELVVKTNLEMKKVRKRLYPDIEVGDYVKLYRKKDKLDKERKSLWSSDKYKVLEITEIIGKKLYTVDKKEYGRDPTYVRSEILLVG